MSVISDLRDLLETTGLPVRKNKYSGSDHVYLTYNYTTLGADYGDNHALEERYLLQIHLIAPIDYNTEALEALIKELLDDAGYPYPSTSNGSDDPATEQHIVFETEAVAGVGAD